MNWDLVKWVAGVLLTLGGIKVAFVLIHRIFSKETINAVCGNINESCASAGEKFGKYLKDKVERKQTQKKESNKPTMIIR